MDNLDDRSRQAPEPNASVRPENAIDVVRIDSGALLDVAPYLTGRAVRRAVIAADDATYEAAGPRQEPLQAAEGIETSMAKMAPDARGDVLADERSLIQLLLELQRSDAEIVIATGGGTMHDIARYAAYTHGIPFVSVPTAPSVDGFASKGAPIVVRGKKITIPAIGPSAIFADLDVLTRASPELIAAGFGDMLGKYTSLFDWSFGAIAGDEPYSPPAAEMTRSALASCVREAEAIGRGREEGVRTLIRALVDSGIAMLLFGQSHPASGAEHHLSHYWEMEFIREKRKQLLHGAKVGVATAEISKLYRGIADGRVEPRGLPIRARERWGEIERAIRAVPDGGELRELLRLAGAPATPEELPIGRELLERSLREAHRVRPERHTLLRAYNEAVSGSGRRP